MINYPVNHSPLLLSIENKVDDFSSDEEYCVVPTQYLLPDERTEFFRQLRLNRKVSQRNLAIRRSQIVGDNQLIAQIIVDRERRKRNKSFDLVGVEENPGPPKKQKQKTVVVMATPVSQSKPKVKKPKVKKASKDLIHYGSAPVAFSTSLPRSSFKITSNIQKLAEQDWQGGVRVSGCCQLTVNGRVYATGTGAKAGPWGALADSGFPNTGYYQLNPNRMDPRLANLVQTFQFYAFRKLKIYWIPLVGSNTAGVIYMGVISDADMAQLDFATIGGGVGITNSVGTPQMLMSYDPARETQIWQREQIQYLHRGTKVWDSSLLGSESLDQRMQCTLIALASDLSGDNTTVPFTANLGKFFVEYEIDLYKPGTPN